VAKLLRFTAMTMVAAASAFVSAGAVVRLGAPAPVLRASSAETRAEAADPAVDPLRSGAVLKGGDGHYWAQAEVNGAPVRFLVDTGATEVALGFDLSRLQYRSSVVTAAGRTRAAAVRLASVTVAGARLEDVDALVIENGLDSSLLGMSYLGRLSSFQATRQALFLRP
jgi:aspartyl protease family protein